MIDEPPQRRMTRAEQRVATRAAILDAAALCLAEDGYAALTTRRIAERAQVAQSTLMHHFPTREQLLTESVSQLALRLADDALDSVDLTAVEGAERRQAVLEQVWQVFTSPQALAGAQLWYAAGTEPELAAALRELEERLTDLVMATASALMPELVDDPDFPVLILTGMALIRGLVMAIPVWGRDAVDERWHAIRPVLDRMAAELLERQAA